MAMCTAEASDVGPSLEYDYGDGSQASTTRRIFPGPIFSKSKCLFVNFKVIHFPYNALSVLIVDDRKSVALNQSDLFFFTMKPR